MPVHDDYARRTPFELIFPDAQAGDRLAAAIADEAEGRGLDPTDRAAFPSLPSVGAYLAEVRGPDAPPAAVDDYAALLYHAFHFAGAGRPFYLLSAEGSRALVRGVEGAAGPEPPDEAGYLQLPQHLFWTADGAESTPESVDGVSWTRTTEASVHLLVATGLRADRPGLGVVQLPEAPWDDAPGWLDAELRPDDDDFANVLPGGGLEALHSFASAGEVLKLFARFCSLLANGGARISRHEPGEREGAGPVPSRLPYYRVEPHA